MKLIIVNVKELNEEEKGRVNEALAKITGATKLTTIDPKAGWFFATISTSGSLRVTWGESLPLQGATHTPDEVLEMAKQGNPHPHSDLLMKYAEISKTDPEPWDHFEYHSDLLGEWLPMRSGDSLFKADYQYRLKPQVKIVHGVEVPDISIDLSGETKRTDFYTPCTYLHKLYSLHSHHKYNDCQHISDRGLCYPYTEEGRRAAILHAKAMLGIA